MSWPRAESFSRKIPVYSFVQTLLLCSQTFSPFQVCRWLGCYRRFKVIGLLTCTDSLTAPCRSGGLKPRGEWTFVNDSMNECLSKWVSSALWVDATAILIWETGRSREGFLGRRREPGGQERNLRGFFLMFIVTKPQGTLAIRGPLRHM